MKNIILYLSFILVTTISFSQGIVVDTTSLSVPSLVQRVLLPNSCANETNVLHSSHRGIGEFTNTNPRFPFTNGIVIRNGIAKYSEGIYTGNNISSRLTAAGDADLQNISNSSGQTGPISDVAFVQFDFTPISNSFSFDFLFASNEYGEYQCSFSDVFTFLLTDLTTGVSTNLAVVPGTTLPISVKNIRNTIYNSSCLSANAGLFNIYNELNPAASAINMKGETVVLKASSAVIPNRTYRIKMAIGDYIDSDNDSAVFINGGSFTATTDLGPDRTICLGEQTTITTTLGSQYSFVWTLNGTPIPGANSASITVNQPGTYEIRASLPNTSCIITDKIVVRALQIKKPVNLTVCNTGSTSYSFNLTRNNTTQLGLNDNEYTIQYYSSLSDANANTNAIPLNLQANYSSIGNQTIYIKVIRKTNSNVICEDLLPFDLIVTDPFTANNPLPITLCSSSTGSANINLTTQNASILNGNPANKYQIAYFSTQQNATNNTNSISTPTAFPVLASQSPITIWARMTVTDGTGCFSLASFEIIINPVPLVSQLPAVIECSSYTLPTIANGRYFTGANGSGVEKFPGDLITVPGRYYIFNGPDANGCSNQSSFLVTLIDQLNFPETGCGRYVIPSTPAGGFYTSHGGLGTRLATGTVLTSNTTIYFYAVINGVPCQEKIYNIIIYSLPQVDAPNDVTTCDSYTLLPLTNGNYFSSPNGVGPLFAGQNITATTTLYIYSNDGRCSNQNSFKVNIVNTALFQPITRCGSFTLPAVAFGTYRTQPNGNGTVIPAGTVITLSQTVYYYANTTTTPNCTDNLRYVIRIETLPLIDKPANRTECSSYTLPPLTNGNYFSSPRGVGPLFAGNIITSTKTIYVYALGANRCPNEHSFIVDIIPLPALPNFTNIFTCTSFRLPFLRDGSYYSAPNGPNGVGVLIPFDTEIKTSQTIYVYNESAIDKTCRNESFFDIEAFNVNVGTFTDVSACDSYILPSLAEGDYYLLPDGQGNTIPAGTAITETQTLYVYKKEGNRQTCSDEDSFIVTINKTPFLIDAPDIIACGSYILPVLSVGNYFSGPNGTGKAYFAGDEIKTSEQMYIYASSIAGSCIDEDLFKIDVYPLNVLSIKDSIICVNNITKSAVNPYYINTQLDPIIYDVEWYLDGKLVGTGIDFLAEMEGKYEVKFIKKTIDTINDCGYSNSTFTVRKSSPAIAKAVVKSDFASTVAIVVELIGGFGNYSYQLDGGPFQTSNVFNDVSSGAHTIVVADLEAGCETLTLNAYVIKYPRFFTPNEDTYNDTWNISDLANNPNSTIYIYDRFGKLIKQVSPSGLGWDGTYNGEELPSTDYWFQVFYDVNGAKQEFKAHFSLVR